MIVLGITDFQSILRLIGESRGSRRTGKMISSLRVLSSDRRFPISEGPICRVGQHSIRKELLMLEKRLQAAACTTV
jgi:hypothetical protein